MNDIKLIIFGTGMFYKNRKSKLPSNVKIIAFLDNNEALWGKTIDNIEIFSPQDLLGFTYDKVLLMSRSSDEMKQQLLALKVDDEKIVTWEEFFKQTQHGRFSFFYGGDIIGTNGRVLIISTPLGYTGAPITALYAAKALQMKGYDVVLCAEKGDENFVDEAIKYGVNVVLCPAIPYLGKEELFWIRQFDMVLVNTFLMAACACEISYLRPTIWWIHECGAKFENYYPDTIKKFKKYIEGVIRSKANILGVSSIAVDIFNEYYPDRSDDVLPYGIPDDACPLKNDDHESKKLVFAVIGTICKRKGQREFLEAINLLQKNKKWEAEFWIIGDKADIVYADSLNDLADRCQSVKVKGGVSRSGLRKIYDQIDIVVCPSFEETMSIVLTEGMMLGKICISTNNTGMSRYIIDKKNGLICEAGNVRSLWKAMEWVLRNKDQLDPMRVNARETYEKYFTLERFAERLEKAMLQAKAVFEANNQC